MVTPILLPNLLISKWDLKIGRNRPKSEVILYHNNLMSRSGLKMWHENMTLKIWLQNMTFKSDVKIWTRNPP